MYYSSTFASADTERESRSSIWSNRNGDLRLFASPRIQNHLTCDFMLFPLPGALFPRGKYEGRGRQMPFGRSDSVCLVLWTVVSSLALPIDSSATLTKGRNLISELSPSLGATLIRRPSNIWIFGPLPPFVMYRNQMILFFVFLFWGPLPHPLRTSYKYSPLSVPPSSSSTFAVLRLRPSLPLLPSTLSVFRER